MLGAVTMDSHEKYVELCAASTAGELSREEEQELEEHLAICASAGERNTSTK